MKAIDYLLLSLNEPRLLFMIGAGISARFIPDNQQQMKLLIRYRQQSSVLPVDGITHDAVKERILIRPATSFTDLILTVIGQPYRAVEEDQEWVVDHVGNSIPASTCRLVHLSCVSQSMRVSNPIEYDIFRIVKPSVIATTNYDGLAERCCARLGHKVLHLHGKCPFNASDSRYLRGLIQDSFWDGDGMLMPVIQKYENDGNMWLPQPETSSVIQKPEYERLIALFSTRSQLIIIGYSFARGDDQQTFDMIIELLKFHPIPVTVVDPYPESIVEEISESAKLKKVVGVKAKWGILAESILQANLRFQRPLHLLSDEVVRLYPHVEENCIKYHMGIGSNAE